MRFQISRESPEYTLILNACEGVLQIVCADAEKIVVSQEWYRENQATEILAPQLEAICHSLCIQPGNFTKIACVHGPGSFTGIRLVLATAMGLSTVSGAECAGINYLEALACEAFLRKHLSETRTLWVFTHARRNLMHAQAFFSQNGEIPRPKTAVFLCDPKESLSFIAEQSICLGSAIQRYPEIFASLCTSEKSPVILQDCVQPSPMALYRMALRAQYSRKDIEPIYVRPCDAVENLERLAARYGIGADEAQKSFDNLLERDPVSSI